MPWSVFEVCFGDEIRPSSSVEFADTSLGQKAMLREARKSQASKEQTSSWVPISRERIPEQKVLRAGKETYKFCACHTHNDSSWGGVYQPAFAMYMWCINHQVDFIMGDGNQHYQFCSKSHKTKVKSAGKEGDTQNCLFNQILRGFVSEINSYTEFPQRLSYVIIDNNPVEAQESQEDLDCIFCHIFGWGKQPACHTARETMMHRIDDLLVKYNARYPKPSHLLYYNGHHMSDEDREWLSEHSDECHPCLAPEDYDVKVSERVKHMTRGDLWLGSNDCDWHLPLLFTIREMPLKNQRARSTKGWKSISAKKGTYQESKGKGKDSKGKGKNKGKRVDKEEEEYTTWHTSAWTASSYTGWRHEEPTWQETPADSSWQSWEESWWPSTSSSSATWWRP